MSEMWCCITPDRAAKTGMLMRSLMRGWPGASVVLGAPPDDGQPFVVWGQEWLTLDIVPPAVRSGRPFFHIDNGYWRPARGQRTGYYRMCYRSMSPILLAPAAADRERGVRMGGTGMRPWRKTGAHILLALPGRHFGLALGFNMDAWVATAEAEIRRSTDRPIVVRERTLTRPLDVDLRDCWALVTHSSNVATEAAWSGVPVFVAPTSPAAPVGNLDLSAIETPTMPDRTLWWASLMSQQFTIDEMANGTARDFMGRVAAQVDQESRP